MTGWHPVNCKAQPITPELVSRLREILEEEVVWADYCTRRLEMLRDQLELYQGKYRTVKHENNQLRKKLRPKADPPKVKYDPRAP